MELVYENVSYSYERNIDKLSLKNVSFSIKQGEYVAIVGSTGSGKSTLAKLLSTLYLPFNGTETYDSFKVSKKTKVIPKSIKKEMGLIFQNPAYQLFDDSVLKDVSFGPKNYGIKKDEAIKQAKETLSLVGFKDSLLCESPFVLSGGEKKLASIAGILVLNPSCILLDEPTCGLDPQTKNNVLSIIRSLNKEGKTIILITHEMNVVYDECDRVLVINHGEIDFDGTPKSLFSDKEVMDRNSLSLPSRIRIIDDLNNNLNMNIDRFSSESELLEAVNA